MTRWGPVRFAAVLALLALVVAGVHARQRVALPVRPALPDRAAAVANTVAMVLVAAGLVLIMLVTILRRRRRRRRRPVENAAAVLPLYLLSRLLVALIAVVGLAALALALWYARRIPLRGGDADRTEPPAPQLDPAVPAGSGWMVALTTLVVVVLFAVFVVGARRRRAVGGGSAWSARPLAREPLAAAVDAGRTALGSTSDARGAIIACYAAMETSLAAHGDARRPADTPTEQVRRAVAAVLVSPGPAEELLTLFHRARFSREPMDAADQRAAEAALDAVTADLRVAR